MDFVAFETFTEDDALPSPQPSLSLPLKSNIENFSAKFTNFKDLKNLLKQQNAYDESTDDENLHENIAEKYASLSLQLLGQARDNSSPMDTDDTSSSARNEALSRRLGRALNSGLSDPEMRDLFSGLEAKVSDLEPLVDSDVDGSIARKSLRGDVEADLSKNYSSALSDYARPVKSLKALGDRVKALSELINGTNALLNDSFDSTAELRLEVSALLTEKQDIQLKQGLLKGFKQKFTLNEYEVFLLESNDINADFFAALSRAEEINEACLILLALDNPALGKTISAKNNELINRANSKIIQFCNRTLSNMFTLNNSARLATLHSCLSYLKDRPGQLLVISDSFIKSRSVALKEDFNLQVSGHGRDESLSSSSNSRPVYLSSHDPVRFVTDLLAYVHSVTMNESETVSALLEGKSDLAETVNEIVKKILGSLSRPVKMQLDRIISAETRLSSLYHIFNHLELYSLMFKKSLHAASISDTILKSMDMIRDKMTLLLTNRLATIRESNLAKIDLSSDLQPPEWIIEYYSDLLPIIDSMTSDTILGLSNEQHDKMTRLIVDEPIHIFNEHLEQVADNFSKIDLTLFKLNFLDFVVSKIMPLRLLGDRMLEVNHDISDMTLQLKGLQTDKLISECDLTDFYNIMNMICPLSENLLESSVYSAMSENNIFTREKIELANATIHQLFPTALLDLQLSLIKLNNPMVVNDVIASSSMEFLKFYSVLSTVVEEHFGEPLFSWTSYEMATLLGIEEEYNSEIAS